MPLVGPEVVIPEKKTEDRWMLDFHVYASDPRLPVDASVTIQPFIPKTGELIGTPFEFRVRDIFTAAETKPKIAKVLPLFLEAVQEEYLAALKASQEVTKEVVEDAVKPE